MDLPLSREVFPSTYVDSWRLAGLFLWVSNARTVGFVTPPLVLLVNYPILIYPLGV
jgi:hypothetical protein